MENLKIYTDDAPIQWFNSPEILAIHLSEIMATAKTAKEYYLTSPDPAAGNSFEERMKNLKTKIDSIINDFKSDRFTEYEKVSCKFYKNCHTSNNHGRTRTKETLRIPIYYILLKETFKRTMNGDFKGGPTYHPDSNYISWVTGTESGSADAFISIHAKFKPDHINEIIIPQDVKTIKIELNKADIPYNE